MKTYPKVNVVISTYNGEKYIQEQLSSLFGQEYQNIDIYVRDDGSSDKTIQILQKYAESGQIVLFKGENVGYCKSFMKLLEMTAEGDYWAFCDQDDIWYPDKVRLAVEWMESQRQDKPLLYYSLSKMIDEEGNKLGIEKPPNKALNFYRVMTGTFGVGFSMVINKALREEMLKCNPEKVHAHDWLAGAVALGFGKVHVNHKICAKYRRLDTSVTRISFMKKIKWALSMLKNDGDVKDRNIEYYRVYKKNLPSEKAKIASLFGGRKYSLRKSLIKAFYPKKWRPGISSEIVMRCLMLIGKV